MSNYWIQTFTGKRFDLLEPTEDMIDIIDIAHHLSLINRWVGASRFPISVAYHSIIVAKHCSEELTLEGLLHDAAEAYISDISYPFKSLLKHLENAEVDEISNQIQELVEFKFDLTINSYDIIKILDLRSAKTERNQALLVPIEQYSKEYEDAEPFPVIIIERNWKNVEQEFLDLYEEYRRV